MALTDYTIPPVQTTADAQVPTSVIKIPTQTPQTFVTPTAEQIGAQYDATKPTVTPEMQAIINENNGYKNLLGLGEQASREKTQQFANMGGVTAQSNVNQLTSDYNLLDQVAKGKEQAYLANRINGGGGTASGTSTTFEGIQRENAVAKWSKLADIHAAQGNVDQAKAASEQAILAKYGDIQAQIDYKKQVYDMNKDTFSRLDKANYEKQLYILDQQEKANNIKIKDATDISNMIIDATPNAPADIVANAKRLAEGGATKLQVATALGKYGGDYLVREKIKAEIRKMGADTLKATADAKGTSGTVGVAGSASDNAKAWLAQYNSGALSLEDIYTKIGSTKEAGVLKNQVAQLVAAQGGKRVYGQDDATVQAINAQVQNINDLLYGKGKTEADNTTGDVGTIVGVVQGGLGISPDKLNVYKQDALATAKNLVSNQTLQALADAKAKGITFGALSEGELGLVSDAASRISSKLKIDPVTKEITGFTGSESSFKDDLKTIKDNLQKSITTKTQAKLTLAESTANDIMTANTSVQRQITGTYNIFGK